MSRLLHGQFSAAATAAASSHRSPRPSASSRALLLHIIDNLQIIGGGNPLALPAFDLLAHQVARPIRERLQRQQLKATLRPPRRGKSSA